MTEQDYLTFLGYVPVTDWMILKPEVYKPLLEISGHQNNMFSPGDPKGTELFGKNFKVVKRAWYNKNTVSTEAEKTSAPPPPVPNSGPEVITPVKEESVLDLRLENLKDKGLTIDYIKKIVLFPQGDVDFDTIENYPNPVWIKVLAKDYSKVAKVIGETPQVTYELAKGKRIEMLASIGLSQDANVYVDKDNTTAIEVLKVNTASDQDFMKSFEAMKGYLEKIHQEAAGEKEIKKQQIIDAAVKEALDEQLGNNEKSEAAVDKVIEKGTVPKSEVEEKIDEAIETSETTQELVDNLSNEFEKEEIEEVIEEIGESKSAIGPGANEIAKAQKPTKLSAADKKLRDVFAGQAMQAYIASGEMSKNALIHNNDITEFAYDIADEMLKSRKL